MTRACFYPISALPAVAAHVESWLVEALEMEHLYAPGPHPVDAATLERTVRIYGRTRYDLALIEEQVRRWRGEELTRDQRVRIHVLSAQLVRIRQAIDSVLAEATQARSRLGRPVYQAGSASTAS